MTGPEHYEAAQSHLQGASRPFSACPACHDLTVAQVHATLALAAATALAVAATQPPHITEVGRDVGAGADWREVLKPDTAQEQP